MKAGADAILGEDIDPAISWWLSTRCTALDLSINRGIPGGRVVEIFGPEGSGKNVLLYSLMREAQEKGGLAILLASEPFSEGLAYNIMGIRKGNQFILKTCNEAEKIVKALEYFIETARGSQVPVIIGVDSVACLQPKDDENVDWEDTPQLAGMARIWTRFFQRDSITSMMGEPVFVVFLNQVRASNVGKASKIGKSFTPPPVEDFATPGGWSLRHGYHVRIQLSRTAVIVDKDTGVTQGQRIQAKVVKNKTGAFPRKVIYPFYNQLTYPVQGIDDGEACIEYLKTFKALMPWTNPETGKTPQGYFELDGFHGRESDFWHRFHTNEQFRKSIRTLVASAFFKHNGVPMEMESTARLFEV